MRLPTPNGVIVRALRTTMTRLAFFYLATLAVMLAVMPWTRAAAGASPFVAVMTGDGRAGCRLADEWRHSDRRAVSDEHADLRR